MNKPPMDVMKKILPFVSLGGLGILIVAASVFSLLFAYTAEYGFGLKPCILCLYQRVPYAVCIGIGIIVILLARTMPKTARFMVYVAALSFLIGAGIALFQVGVEHGWWKGTDACTGSSLAGLSASDFLDRIKSAPVVRCDDVQFSFLGISMAGYNGIWGVCLAAVFAILPSFLRKA